MARITAEQRRRYGPHLTGMVPGDVLAQIDSRELADRLAQAGALLQRVAKAETPGAGRPLGEEARRILGARPRADTEQIVKTKIAKARSLGDGPQAAALERQAREELLNHPPAVRRFHPADVVAKAKADKQLMACFDSSGKLWGVVDPDEIQLVDDDSGSNPATAPGNAAPAQPGSPQQPAPASAAGQPVAKAAAKKQMKAVYDQQGRLIGLVDPDAVDAVLTSLPAATEAIAKAHARMRPVAKSAVGGRVAVYDQHGQLTGYARPEDIADPASAQAQNTGPVNAGGTTGLGQPRNGGPQGALPGDLPGRQVVKASRPHVYARDVTSRTAACVCKSAMRAPVHTELAPGVPNPAARR
jgi:YD repeat-containing protein